MKKGCYVLLFLLFISWNIKKAKSQNVVFIMADDLGLGDFSCYGSTMIETPNIDKLASQGLKFDNFYTAGSVSTPTRYSILTGRYPIRRQEIATGQWDGNLLVETNHKTIASIFKQKGYKTAAIGKWHLGYGVEGEPDFEEILKPGPLELGFDYHWGVPMNHSDKVRAYVENYMLYGLDPNSSFRLAHLDERRVQGLLHEREDDLVNALLTERVMKFIHENRHHPFFVYFTPTIAHTHVTPYASFRGTSKAGQYGDFVQELDFYIGEIMALLDELKLTENTILIVTSDNGGQLKDYWTAGMGLNLADESKQVREKAKTPKIDARKMGHKTNLDLRKGKGSPYDGGFRVPLIIRWPNVIEAGATTNRLVCSSDFLATFSGIFDVELSETDGEDSFNFSDEFLNSDVSNPRTNVVLHSNRGRSYIDGEWKLIDFSYSIKNPADSCELYHIAEDPSELNDLASKEPKRVQKMKNELKNMSEAKKAHGD